MNFWDSPIRTLLFCSASCHKPTRPPPQGGSAPDSYSKSRSVSCLRNTGSQSRSKFRPDSNQANLPARDRFQLRLASSKMRQPPGAFTLDESAQAFPDQCRPALQPGKALDLFQQPVIDVYGSPHPIPLSPSVNPVAHRSYTSKVTSFCNGIPSWLAIGFPCEESPGVARGNTTDWA